MTDQGTDINPETQLQLQQLQFEREKSEKQFKLEEMRIKWVSCVVAIVLALIAALGGWVSGFFEYVINKTRVDGEISDQDSRWQKEYIDSYIKYALDKDLSNRRDFALYVFKTSRDGDFKKRWNDYYDEILSQIEAEESNLSDNLVKLKQLDSFRDADEISILRGKNEAILNRIQGVTIKSNVKYVVPPKTEIDRSEFFSCYSTAFDQPLMKEQVEAYEAIFGLWDSRESLVDTRWLAYFLATIRHEVGEGMLPVREGFARTDEEARKRLAHLPYAKSEPPYGHAYYGRGYVLLTFSQNYKKIGAELGVDLVQFPDLALDPSVAFDILTTGMLNGTFNARGIGLSEYINEEKEDVINARRTVNVLDRASEVANTFYNYKECLK